ncbi:cytochrome c oxidase assembly protein [Ciceribacter sp. L1K22]|nr:cytochrome c oxidase assembly protein [Ciceribacter sp. L1K22]
MTDPYCGPAPDPSTLWSRWNFDPPLLVALGLLAVLIFYRSQGKTATLSGLTGWLLLFVAFVSPLCALASALFSARVLHHVVLVAGAAPLLAVALPWKTLPVPRLLSPGLILGIHTLLFWFWHSPAAYAFALSSDAAYWLMQASLFGSALWVWAIILSPHCQAGTALTLLLGSILQMGMLAALLTFSRGPLYEAHFLTTSAFGLTPLQDQQLAGVLMWVPAALPYLIVALMRLRTLLQDEAEGNNAP